MSTLLSLMRIYIKTSNLLEFYSGATASSFQPAPGKADQLHRYRQGVYKVAVTELGQLFSAHPFLEQCQ